MIRDVLLSDAGQIAAIYNHYVRNTIITFEYEPVSEEEMKARIIKIKDKNYPFFVYEDAGMIKGYAYLSNWRERVAYDITLETSIYLDYKDTGQGLGTLLYQELIDRSKKIDIHSLIGVVSLPNEVSSRIHRKFAFASVGIFREAGMKFGKLIDAEFWQLIL